MSLCDEVVRAKSNAAAEELLRRFFAEHAFDSPLPASVLELLQHHPRWADKASGGALHAEKIRASGSFALVLSLRSGARESIDWKAAVRALRNGGKELNGAKREAIRKAFRMAVRDQVCEARAALGGSLFDGKDLDHVVAFAALLAEFLAAEKVALDNVAVCKQPGVGTHWRMADTELEARWKAHHEAHAQYQLLTRAEHVEITRSRREVF